MTEEKECPMCRNILIPAEGKTSGVITVTAKTNEIVFSGCVDCLVDAFPDLKRLKAKEPECSCSMEELLGIGCKCGALYLERKKQKEKK